MNTAQKTVLHLSLIPEIGHGLIGQIVAAISPVESIYDYTQSDLMDRGFTPRQALIVVQGLRDTTLLDQERALLEHHNISLLSLADAHYPQLLKEIHDPPAVIYVQGAPLDDKHNCIAVIGSRKADAYGKAVITTLIPTLVDYRWTIVSGGALGADAMAHQATVAAGGKTVVVLGSGLLRPSPRTNCRLFDEVVYSGGTMVSSFPLRVEATAYTFPERNRIIAGLSRGCVVVQAASASGTFITAKFALDQGRDVFAVPGPIADPLSAGCHSLIQQGAKLVANAADILVEYGYVVPEPDAQPKKTAAVVGQQAIPLEPAQKSAVPEVLTGPEGILVQACASPCSMDDLIVATGLPLQEVQALLFKLQLEGFMTQNFAGQWEKVL